MSPRHAGDGTVEAARQRRAMRLGGALFLCVMVAAVAVAWNDLRVRQAAGERYVQALVDSHARQLGQELANIERAFRGVGDATAAVREIAPEATPALAREAIAAIAARHRRLGAIRTSHDAPPFVSADAAVPQRLYMGKLARGGDGRWGIPIAMRLDPGAEGTLWLHARLDPDIFSEVLAAHEVGEDGVASVLTTDGVLIVRSDSGTLHAGLDAGFSPVFQASRSAATGVVESRSRLDGIRRVVGFRVVEGQPLVATVGMTPMALHGGWWAFVATLALGMALLLAALMVGLRFLRRAARRELDMRRGIADREHTLGHLRERVRDAEAQYRFLYQQHPLPAVVYDRETLAILEVNDAAVHQYGYPREAMLGGLAIDALLAEESADEIHDELRAHPAAYGRRVWVQRRRDGSTFSALVFACNLESFAERPARVVLSLDVTDRLRAESNLRLLRRAVEASEEGVFIIDLARRTVVYGNAAIKRLTGVDPELEPTVDAAAEMVVRDEQARRTLLDSLRRTDDISVEFVQPGSEGAPHWLEVRMSPVFDAEGRPTHYVGVVTDITMRKRASEEMAFRASHDALSGLANRDRLLAAIDEAIAAGAEGVVVCHLDLDRFQLVNDSLGHGVGDELLVSVARRLEAATGPTGLVARVGGDEFGVLLRDLDAAAAHARVEVLRMAVAEANEVRSVALHVTPSVGYSCHPADGGDGTALLRAASQAGAHAKRAGRNRSVAYRPQFDSRAGERLALVRELHRALQRDEFELAFQLQFDVGDRPRGMEALVRWRHPERGLLGPHAFMDACEDSGLVLPLGRWVLREAARCWCLLEERGWGRLRMGVNVSALQIQGHLVDDVAQAMADYGVPRCALELELTESVLLASPDAARRVMEALSDLGVSIAIDDFGTGYSSLAYLKLLPLQRLKLDQSFVRDLGRDPDNEAICMAILGMAQSLELRVTAEGVETAYQHEWLRSRGCEEFQGYLLAMPAPFDEVLDRLGQGPGR